ncbi:tail fiber domain-containing protein, partial [Burkholderia sp. SIMBA_024]|uniref:tail fiber domain-containing protein n=1 Tax=Burkholderia sp. SIMBA_024 TaxID=3085768 RepID=UPI00397AA889
DVSASSYVYATAANQFTGLFNGGYRFLTNRSNTALGMFVDAVGNVTYSGSSTSVSDVRLKKDIQTLTGVLDNIKQIRGVNYYWKDTSKGTD